MSLINEALRRARDESARREAAARGVPLAPVRKPRARTRWLAVAVLALAVALLASLGLLMRVTSKIPSAATMPGGGLSPAADSTAAGAEIEPNSTLDARPTETADQRSRRPQSPQPAPPQASTPVSTRPTPTASQPTEGRSERELPAATPRTSSPPTTTEPNGEQRIQVRRAELSDGQFVDLGGIAWSETGPFALLNGRVVGIGESVRGYIVVEISPSQVTLERGDEQILLRLK